MLLTYGPAIREPFDRTQPGSETSTYWVGYMDGAVRSDEGLAAEALVS